MIIDDRTKAHCKARAREFKKWLEWLKGGRGVTMGILAKPTKCVACSKKLTKKDYFELCKKCQPAYQLGRKIERQNIKCAIEALLESRT